MVSAFSPILPGHKHIFRGWLPPVALQPRDYAALIRDSIFVPCPTGTIHVECYRAYEAAYLGAIPVVTSDYYAKYFEAPFPKAPNWHDAAQQVLELQQDLPRLSSLQRAVSTWISTLPAATRSNVHVHLMRRSSVICDQPI